MDSYFKRQDKPAVFLVLGKGIVVDNEQLATALSRLPKLRHEVLLLYYFLGYHDKAIGRLYGRCRSSINRRRNVALKHLSIYKGHINDDTQDRLKTELTEALFKFHFDR